jgi:hypothetical protein
LFVVGALIGHLLATRGTRAAVIRDEREAEYMRTRLRMISNLQLADLAQTIFSDDLDRTSHHLPLN